MQGGIAPRYERMDQTRRSRGTGFVPPFCPNPACVHHGIPRFAAWWARNGFHGTQAFGTVPRYRCRSCTRTFSRQTFRLDYYAKRLVDYPRLHHAFSESMGIRALGRFFSLSPGSVQNRLDRLGRQTLGLHSILRKAVRRDGDVCVDGFQSFDLSQYFPNNYTISMSSRSLFALEMSHATLRRSGSMTRGQRLRRDEFDRRVSYEKKALERSFTEILDQVRLEYARSDGLPLVIVSDGHRAYSRAFGEHPLFKEQTHRRLCVHYAVSSKAARTRHNPLFASNYIDRQIRKDQAAHRRETACHCRNAANGSLRLWAYLGYHNYRKRFRINAWAGDERTHAEAAGIPRRSVQNGLAFAFERRFFRSRLRLSACDERAWLKKTPTPLKVGGEYVPAYAVA